MKRFLLISILVYALNFVTHSSAEPSRAQPSSLWLEKLTSPEVQTAIDNGYTQIIIPTGGIEQNGPFVELGKHNLIVTHLSELIAKNLAQTLIAPVVKYVPEGEISPPQGHMKFAGTISLKPSIFTATILEICRSLTQHGFKKIILIGDSYDNQKPLNEVEKIWKQQAANPQQSRVIYIPEYYNYQAIEGLLDRKGIKRVKENFHDSLPFSLQLLVIEPSAVRSEQRIKANNFQIEGVNLLPIEKFIALGQEIIDFRAQETVNAIRNRN
ncbi:creatininase family protein [bacterium]|nr:creatininase family protein [bacterium]